MKNYTFNKNLRKTISKFSLLLSLCSFLFFPTLSFADKAESFDLDPYLQQFAKQAVGLLYQNTPSIARVIAKADARFSRHLNTLIHEGERLLGALAQEAPALNNTIIREIPVIATAARKEIPGLVSTTTREFPRISTAVKREIPGLSIAAAKGISTIADGAKNAIPEVAQRLPGMIAKGIKLADADLDRKLFERGEDPRAPARAVPSSIPAGATPKKFRIKR